MDYLDIAQKVIKFYDFNMTQKNLELIFEIKKNLNYELELFGSLIRDYLFIQNDFQDLSEDIFSDFLLFVDDKDKTKILEEIAYYSKIYKMIVFEKTDDRIALWGITTVNSCYKVEFYPILMKILYMYYNLKINSQQYNIMLQSLVDITIKCFANPKICPTPAQVSQRTIENNIKITRYAG